MGITEAAVSVLCILPLLVSGSAKAKPRISFNIPWFNASALSDQISTAGAAHLDGNVIQLTRSDVLDQFNSTSGWATFSEPLQLWISDHLPAASFQSQFSFIIQKIPNNKTFHADGIAFFLTSYDQDDQGPPSMSSGMQLGLFNSSTEGTKSAQTVAVEFDTFKNVCPSFFCNWTLRDPDDNHVGIDVNSMDSVVTASLGNRSHLNDNITWNVWVEYSGTHNLLQVFITNLSAKPRTALLSYPIDLRQYLPKLVRFGFSASTGLSWQLHMLLSWSFSSSPSWNTAEPPFPCYAVAVVAVLAIAAVVTGCCFLKGRLNRNAQRRKETRRLSRIIETELKSKRARAFKYIELSTATNNFDPKFRLGSGGSGTVFNGTLPATGEAVAVKRIARGDGGGGGGSGPADNFIAEVTVINQLRHRNLVPLLGWCHDKYEFLAVVYKLMPGGSLEKYLFAATAQPLNWEKRYKIACGLASAITYLHEECRPRVLHRDIKPNNVMLDADFNAKLGDFGLAGIVKGCESGLSLRGYTLGYTAPECITSNRTNAESDTFSFGVVCLEIASGRQALRRDEDDRTLLEWIWHLHSHHRLLEAADPRLCGEFDEAQMIRLLLVGLCCCHYFASCRLPMHNALHCLTNIESALPQVPPSIPWDYFCAHAEEAEVAYEGEVDEDFGTTPALSKAAAILPYTDSIRD